MTTTPPSTEPVTVAPAAPTPPALPSVHARVAITWLAIFPLVALGMLVMAPFTGEWHPVLRALLLTLVVVPLAVYVVVPRLAALYGRLRSRR
jgi:antibiotic biosynthesis monooxygenase (ABM) superfamily enzyme